MKDSFTTDGHSIIFDIWTKIRGQLIQLNSTTVSFLPELLERETPRLQIHVDIPNQFTRDFRNELRKAENRGKQKAKKVFMSVHGRNLGEEGLTEKEWEEEFEESYENS